MAFTYTITHKEKYSLLTLKGRIIESNHADEMLADIQHHLYEARVNYVLMLNDVESLQRSGLSVLIKLLAITRMHGGNVVLTALPVNLQQTEDGKNLRLLFQISDNEYIAAACLNNAA
ncbi:MAG: anti-sigma factor antagonist [Bacteroidia bacterium]|nr:anti-sigma factor antagonist [Bacteroidia bacterium]